MQIIGDILPFGDDITDALDELQEDHRTDSLIFVRDDVGDWYVKVNADIGPYSASQWRTVEQEFAPVLDAEHDRTKPRD